MKLSNGYKLTLVCAFIFIFSLFAVGYYRNLAEKKKLNLEKAKLTEELSSLNEHLESINYDLENSDSLQFIEKEARALGMIKPGETIIIDMDKEKGGKKEDVK